MPRQRTTPRVQVKCLTCGSDFEVRITAIERGRGRYCSRRCTRDGLLYSELIPVEERFWAKVDKNGPTPEARHDLGPCWLWTGYVDAETGYGKFLDRRKNWNAHHWAYTRWVGPIPEGWDRDHLCRVKRCVNWDHLEPVPHRINVMRGSAPTVVISQTGRCARGHEATPENVYRRKSNGKTVYCRPCRRERRAAGVGI